MAKDENTNGLTNLVWLLFNTVIAMIGYTINGGSLGWAIVDFCFSPIALVKWLICHEITFAVIHQTFSFLG